jgi:hypothetical protein
MNLWFFSLNLGVLDFGFEQAFGREKRSRLAKNSPPQGRVADEKNRHVCSEDWESTRPSS